MGAYSVEGLGNRLKNGFSGDWVTHHIALLKSITLFLLLPGMLDVLPQVASYSQKLSLAQLKYAFDKFTAAGIHPSE